MKRAQAAILWTFLVGLLVLAVCSAAGCSDGDKSCDAESSNKESWTRDDIDDGIVPLLFMTKNFLHVIQPRSLADYKEIWNDTIDGNFFVNHSDSLLWYLSGYIACILVGILFIIILPIVGLCFCCCRCCGKCGARYNDSDLKTGDCTRRTCCLFLFIFTSFMFAAVICALVLNFMVANEVQYGGVTDDAKSSLKELDSYRDTVLKDMRTYGLDKFNDTKVDVYSRLDKTPEQTVEKLENITNAGPTYKTLSSFAEHLDILNASMKAMKHISKELETKITPTLVNDLNRTKTNLMSALELVDCTGGNLTKKDEEICNKTLNMCKISANNLTTSVDFSSVSNLDGAILAVEQALNNNFKDNVKQIRGISDRIMQDVRNKTEENIIEAKKEVDGVQNKLEEEYNKIVDSARNLGNISVFESMLNEYQKEYISTYGEYAFYIILGLILFLLVITLCFYTGLACGALCQRPRGPSGGCGDTVCGARFLMAAVYLGFIFCWLYMMFTMTFFAVGGPLHTELCHHAENLNTSPVVTKFEETFRTRMKNLSIQYTYGNCSENKAIYTAMDLDKLVNISEYLDIDKTGITKYIDSIKNLTINIENITIITPELNKTLQYLDSVLTKVKFDSYWREINKPLINTNVTLLIQNLNQLENYTGHKFTMMVEELIRVQNSTMELRNLKQNLSIAVETAERIVRDAPLQTIISNFTEAETRINIDGSSEIKKAITEVANTILRILQDSMHQVDSDVRSKAGKCYPLYSAVHTTIRAGCVYFLYSFNGLWFCFGWFLFFLLPSIILAVNLAKYYHIPRSPLTALGIMSSDTLKRQKANLGQKKIEIPRPSLAAEVHRNSANVEHYADFYQYSPDDVQLNKLDRRSFYPGWGSENPTFVADYSRDALHSPRSPGPAFGVQVMPHLGRMVPGSFKFDMEPNESPPPYSDKDNNNRKSKKANK